MGFVPRLFKNTTILVGIICFSLLSTSVYAATKILVWGDSLSAAYGIPVDKGWVSLLGTKLGEDFDIINGSISGETTQGGLTRLDAALEKHNPNLVILELGANDGLRGIAPNVTKRNLQQMIEQSKQAKAEVLLMGMRIPPNYGVAYSQKFEEQFAELAKDFQLPFIPFFLEKIINDIANFQSDQLHPTAAAQPIILETVLPTIKDALRLNTQETKNTTEDSLQQKEVKATLNPA